MNPDQAYEIFQTALDLPAGERAAYLDRACADAELRCEVRIAEYWSSIEQ
jgi:hypothetical protein